MGCGCNQSCWILNRYLKGCSSLNPQTSFAYAVLLLGDWAVLSGCERLAKKTGRDWRPVPRFLGVLIILHSNVRFILLEQD